MADRETTTRERSSEEIKRDIDRTRSRMDETVDEIEEHLSGTRLLEEVWHRIRSGGGVSAVGETARDHPIPLALMGVGLTWLAVELARDRDGHRRAGPGTWARAEGRVGPYGPEAVHRGRDEGMGAAVKEKGDAMKEKVSGATTRAREAASAAGERASEAAHSLEEAGERVGDKAREAAEATGERVRHGAERARAGFDHLMDENPLVLGALAFGLGLASGLAVPSTRWEYEQLGPISDTVKEEARETAEKAKHVAAEAAEAGREELRHQTEREGGPGGAVRDAAREVKESAEAVASSAMEAGREKAEEEDLTGEGMRREAEETGRRARERSKAKSGDD